METVSTTIKFEVEGLDFYYGSFRALKNITVKINSQSVTALIGPSGCGKSTFLRTLNRMNDLIDGTSVSGKVKYDGVDIYTDYDVIELRKRIGMVFQKPNPFPMSIHDNVAYGPRVHGIKHRRDLEELVESSLRAVYLWDEVKDNLKRSALALSGGQQQRLCIARAIAVKPDILLMDEPTSALDPISTSRIEDLLEELKRRYTIIIVTHNMQQAGRVSDYTGFFLTGDLVEFAPTKELFFNPSDKRTENYISGRFG